MQKKIKGVNRVFLITVLAYIGFSLIYEIAAVFGVDIFMGSYALQLIYSQILLVLPAAVYMLVFERNIKVLRFKKIDILTILLCILLYICISPLLTFLNSVSLLYSTNVISDVMYSVSDELPFAFGLLLIAIVPACFEEMTYRGLYYNTYREKSIVGGAVMCGLLFGLMHGNLNQFTYAFALGMVFALVVEATDSLWSTIIIHFLVNMSSVVLIYILPKALGYVQQFYDSAMAEGDTQTAELIVSYFGTDEFTMDAMLSLTETTASSPSAILSLIGSYIIPAIIGGVFAFLLYRLIAKRCGRWEIICNAFSKKETKIDDPTPVRYYSAEDNQNETEAITEQNVNTPEIPLVPQKKPHFITWEFVTGGSVMAIEMIWVEIMLRIGGTM